MAYSTDEQVEEFRRANGLDPRPEDSPVWMAQLGTFEFPLPNFDWRRRVLVQHDRHHLLTGYETTAQGELLMASWELGAEVYSDWRQRALCRFLMALGLITCQRKALAAYRRGQTWKKTRKRARPAG